MNYKAHLEQLSALSAKRGMNFDLTRFVTLCNVFGNPQNSFKSVHVAGTNGKGSTSYKIAKSCELSGLKTGLYTSPHIATFRERIQVNSKPIQKEGARALLSQIFATGNDYTFFEVLTLLAFLYFREEKVDIAIIEVGLGGRLDATNVITPILSVITSIDLDHTAILGSTLDAIAFEKGGIIKESVPVVLGAKAQKIELLHKLASERNAPLILSKEASVSFYDDENRETARAALNFLNVKATGLDVRPKCRFEEVGVIILDVAHNPDGFRRCFEAMKLKFPQREINLLMGMSQDKDIESALKIAAHYAHSVHFVPCSTSRSADPNQLLKIWLNFSQVPAYAYKSVEEALKFQITLALGSFYIMHRVRKALGIIEPCDPIPLGECIHK